MIGKLVPWYIDNTWPGVRPSALGRTCWIDDQLRDAIQNGAEQIVILGAGFDCRTYRLPNMENKCVFELDHPDTLIFKKKCLISKFGSLPQHVTYVEIDFDHQDLSTVLSSTTFNRARVTFFLWEGLMHYLTAEAVDKTLRTIASLSTPGSRLVFTYIHQGLLDGTVQFEKWGSIPATLQESDESWTFGLSPADLADYLAKRGFLLINDVSSTEYRSKYMGPSGGHLKGFEFYR